jgi:mRNA-degrading endonuclease RelE of RelBE toxin-antitoxin system
MNLKLITLDSFAKDVKRLHKKYKNIATDLKWLKQTLLDDPKSGVELSRHCYKIRLANSSVPTGKSGGFRVVYYYLDADYNLYLMSIYSKSEMENISEERLLDILKENGLW